MNIDDVKDGAVPSYTFEALEHIFQRQLNLMEKYHPIEAANGLLLTEAVPVVLDDRFGQARLKDFAWRVTEELAESTEALGNEDNYHALEETVDALHFLIELYILAGVSPLVLAQHRGFLTADDLLRQAFTPFRQEDKGDPIFQAYSCVEDLGKAMNCLKQKPWKQTHVLTDRKRFHAHLSNAFYSLLRYAWSIGHTDHSLFTFYFKKSEVNKFRQRSGY